MQMSPGIGHTTNPPLYLRLHRKHRAQSSGHGGMEGKVSPHILLHGVGFYFHIFSAGYELVGCLLKYFRPLQGHGVHLGPGMSSSLDSRDGEYLQVATNIHFADLCTI